GVTLGVVCLVTCLVAGPRDRECSDVQAAVDAGLPRTAAQHLGAIIIAATADRAFGEAAKAVTLKVSLEASLEAGRRDGSIVRLQAELDRAPAELKPVIEVLLARAY